MPKRKMTLDPELAAEAKSIVAIAFRNGPIEDVHAGKACPTCAVYKLLWLKQNDPQKYEETVEFGNRYTRFWDDPKTYVG